MENKPRNTQNQKVKKLEDMVQTLSERNEELETKISELTSLIQRASGLNNICTTEVSDEIIEKVEYKQPSSDKLIRITNLCIGSLYLTDSSSQKVLVKFDKYGETKNVLYHTLVDIVNSNTKLAEKGAFFINDKDAVYYLGLHDAYQNIYDKTTFDNLLSYSVEEIKEIVNNMTEFQKKNVLQLILIKYANDGEADLNKVEVISKILNFNFSKAVGEYKSRFLQQRE